MSYLTQFNIDATSLNFSNIYSTELYFTYDEAVKHFGEAFLKKIFESKTAWSVWTIKPQKCIIEAGFTV
jgi:hypothetical protein